MSIIEPFIPEGVNANNNYTFTCIDRVNSNYKIADINSSNYNEEHFLKSYTGDNAISYASSTTFNNYVGIGTSSIVPTALLNINSKVIINNSNSPPANGITGGSGARLILSPGSVSTTPMCIGCSTNNLWFNVPSNNSIFFYCGLTEQFIITNSTIYVYNISSFRINNSILDLGSGTSNTPIYLSSSGSSLLGINNTINQYSPSSAIGDCILRAQTSKKLILQSGTITSAITILDNGNVGIKTIPTTSLDINGNIKIITTDSLPLISQNGSNGDRIILKEGITATNTYPYAIGCSSDKLWFNIPLNTEHYFFINGTKTLSIRPDAIDISITDVLNMSLWLSQSGGSLLGCSSLNTQYSLSALIGDTVLKSKTNQKLILQSGNDYSALTINSNNYVGIGIINPQSLLHLHSSNNSTDIRIKMTDNTTGTANDGVAIIKTTAQDMSLINYENANMLFYTNNIERMIIKNDGNVGIGTNNPGSYKLNVNGTTNISSSISGTSLVNITQNALWNNSNYALNVSGYTNMGGFRINGNDSVNSILQVNLNTDFSFSQNDNNTTGGNINFRTYGANGNITFNTSGNEKIRINPSGNIGIGTNNPQYALDIYNNVDSSQKPFIRLRGGGGPGNQVGIILDAFYNRTGTASTKIHAEDNGNGAANLCFSTAETGSTTNAIERMRIKTNGYIGIGNNNPNNILQVGAGGRLRISNGNTDYTLLGTQDTDGSTNTRIVLSGSTRTGLNGVIQYLATTTTGYHSFLSNETSEIVRMTPDDFQIKTSCSTYGNNYFTDGEYLFNMFRTNTAGTVKQGYFYTTEYFFNSLVMLAISHTDSTYSYWHGYLGTNNSTQILYITAFQQSNITIENFVEQTTNKTFIYLRPTSSYNASVQMRVKFYG